MAAHLHPEGARAVLVVDARSGLTTGDDQSMRDVAVKVAGAAAAAGDG